MRDDLGGKEELPEGWGKTIKVVRETGRKVLGMATGQQEKDRLYVYKQK